MVPKTTNVTARIEPELKEQAESILAALGIPASSAVNMFYRQIVMTGGIPFELKLLRNILPDISGMTDEEILTEVRKGHADMKSGKVRPAGDTFAELREGFDL